MLCQVTFFYSYGCKAFFPHPRKSTVIASLIVRTESVNLLTNMLIYIRCWWHIFGSRGLPSQKRVLAIALLNWNINVGE